VNVATPKRYVRHLINRTTTVPRTLQYRPVFEERCDGVWFAYPAARLKNPVVPA